MSILRILNSEGDTALAWTVDDPATVEVARAKFDEVIKEGYMAFRIDDPTSGEVIRDFDPEAKEVILTAPLVGG